MQILYTDGFYIFGGVPRQFLINSETLIVIGGMILGEA